MTGRPPRTVSPVTVTAVTDGGAVETAVMTSSAVSTDTANDTVTVWGFVALIAGAAAVAAVVKVRRGTTASGTQIGATETQLVVATDKYVVPFCFSDQPGLANGLQYTVTVTETSASGDGTVSVATIACLIS